MKHFTLDEANAMLEEVGPLAERMASAHRELRRHRDELETTRRAVSGNGGQLDAGRVAALEAAVDEASGEVARCVAKIQAFGAQVKDLDHGLVDFPTRRPADGSTVLLCWRLGEEAIGYWHGVEEGFAGRKPLPL